jgi:choline dehydrogenase-like flavoprotein
MSATSARDGAFDYVIVGSGAAGASAARVLVDTGRSVAVVEEGARTETAMFSDRVLPSMRALYRDMGFQLARGRATIPVIQGVCLGGSTVINSAIVRRMPEEVWHSWDRDHGTGGAFSWKDLEARWDMIEDELSVAPSPREVWGENNALMDRGRAALGLAGGPISRYVRECRGSARCQLGCPHGAKQSMLVSYLPYAERRGATLFTGSRVDRVLFDGDRATGVAGASFRILARRAVIVAASAVQTPLLLARSGIRSAHLGRHFQGHPGTAVVGLFDRPVRMWSGATQGYEIDEYRDTLRAKIETVSLPPETLFAGLPGVGRRWLRAMAESEHAAAFAIALRAFGEGRVSAGRSGSTAIAFDLQPRDMDNLRMAMRRTADLLFAAGAREVIPGIHGVPERLGADDTHLIEEGPPDPAAYAFILSHLFGTARMSARAGDGVIGTDFAIHGRRALYVVDSSIFPTNLGVNPQHSIMAIAMHAAERIAGG